MKNSWLIWIFIVGIVVTVLVAFNYQGGRDAVPLSEIFPDETYPVEIEYEFVDSDEETSTSESSAIPVEPTAVASQTIPEKAAEPVETATPTATETTATAVAQTVPAAERAAVAPADYAYTIQVASFKKKERADNSMKELLQKEYAAFVVSKNLGDKGTWYRVYVGNFDAKNQAEEFLSGFKQRYENSFIISSKKK